MQRPIFTAVFLVMIGCGQTGTSPDSDQQTAAATFHHKTGGSRPAVGRVFNRNLVVTDAFFNDYEALDVSAVQRFLSASPYGRSWLASATTGSRSVAQTIVSLSREYGINPILMLSRMQVEASLVSPSDRPSQRRIDYAMGCGCADGTQCAYAPVGLEAQLRCAADRFRGLYDLSANGTGWWKKGLPKQTLDTIEVIPESHATAALYAYTPWVLQGQGGTWLAWHIVERFDRHIRANANDFTAANQPNDTDVGTTYTVHAGDSCWSASFVLGCSFEAVENCSSSMGCDRLQVGDILSCGLDTCPSIDDPDNALEATPSCQTYTVTRNDTCSDVRTALNCSNSNLTNCTEPEATCRTLWVGDTMACDPRCCP